MDSLGFKLHLSALALALGATGALAQVPTTGQGTSRDGTSPSAGAIMGGSVDGAKKDERSSGAGGDRPAISGTEKCKELSGTLEEQCLRDLRNDDALKREPVRRYSPPASEARP